MIIYCRANDWPISLGGRAEQFKVYPMWEARYVRKSGFKPATSPDIDWKWEFSSRENIPWDRRSGLQYAGTVPTKGGFSADYNVMDMERLGLTPPPNEEDDVTNKELADKISELTGRLDSLKGQVQDIGAGLTSLTKELRDHTKNHVAPPILSPVSRRTYIVKPGDSLSLIARNELGQAGHFRRIAVLNNIPGPAYTIRVGQELVLPNKDELS